jgi:hypothetical protein
MEFVNMEFSERPIIAVDFDGTLCEAQWPGIGAPIWPMIRYIKARKEEGARLILWTCRCGDELQEAVDWARAHGIEFEAVNANLPDMIALFEGDSRKIFAHEYIDDKAVNVMSLLNL